ncbi:helix-turn-helix transcriptional regulator [Winogradskya humida]|uniref:Transcriptional regulator n=1 Tax=Winogradskya humida TaxID=113566 RepID=A0ABQ4A0Y3_9ACTN|nr:helix-turn-helix transcriptional regulator [Actinoplanes humidus]GIE24497.1 transcriptional regulator [Actinoplanes humidus]
MSGDKLLGDFLKARRGRIQAHEAGLTSYGRRRVPGLRRDELARLAGVSEHYLIRLEQGTDHNPSAQVLQALATALRLDRDETAHLYALAAPPPSAARHDGVSDDVQQLLDSWSTTPAYVRNRRFDVLAANKLAMALSPLYTPGQNLVRGMFHDPGVRLLFPDWAEIAAQTTAALRAEADPRDPATADLITSMLTDNDFRDLWADHDVRPTRNEMKRFHHPSVGALTLRRQTLSNVAADDQVIITYQSAPSSPDADALAKLL